MVSCRLAGFSYQPAIVFLTALTLLLTACQPRRTVTLALLGDINLGRGVTPAADSFGFLTSRLRAADLAIANLESPLGERIFDEAGGYNLCAPADRSVYLADWGLDLLSLANNHRFDCGEDGPLSTASLLENAGLTPVGLTAKPIFRQVNGLRLAFFAFDDILAPLDADVAAQSIRTAHEEGALVIVSIHWGAEYQAAPTKRQETLARQFTEAGAALVWGHHPHVVQPAQWLKPPAGSESTGDSAIVLYSLGNALFDQGGLDDTRRSALVLVTLDVNGVASVEAIPFEMDVVHSRVVEPEAETAEKILERLQIP